MAQQELTIDFKTTGNMKKLTTKQESFANAYVLNGGNATDAYRQSYTWQGMSDNALSVEACRTLALPNVSLRVQELRQPMIQEAVASIEERKKLLSEAVRKGLGNGKMTPKDGLRAVDLLNQMDGLYVTRTESKNAVIVKLVIEEENPEDVIEG